jgi:hypothetical protein
MRLVAGIALVVHGVTTVRGETAIGPAIPQVLAAGAGILLLAGLWTPIAGALVAVIELWSTLSQAGDPWIHILLGTLGGPGTAWTWGLVGRCSPFWMEANRHSRPADLALVHLYLTHPPNGIPWSKGVAGVLQKSAYFVPN